MNQVRKFSSLEIHICIYISDGVTKTRFFGIAACACICVCIVLVLSIYMNIVVERKARETTSEEVPNGNVCISNITIYTNRSCQSQSHIPFQPNKPRGEYMHIMYSPFPCRTSAAAPATALYVFVFLLFGFSFTSSCMRYVRFAYVQIATEYMYLYILHTCMYYTRACMYVLPNECVCDSVGRHHTRYLITRTRSFPFKVKE